MKIGIPRFIGRGERHVGISPGGVEALVNDGHRVFSRMTSLHEPTFVEEEVIHYCVPNMASAVGRTATYAITNAILPLVREIANLGISEATRGNHALARGVNVYRGRLINSHVAASFHRRHEEPDSLLEQEARSME